MSYIIVDDLTKSLNDEIETLSKYDLSSIPDDMHRYNLETIVHYTSLWKIMPDGTHKCLEFKKVEND